MTSTKHAYQLNNLDSLWLEGKSYNVGRYGHLFEPRFVLAPMSVGDHVFVSAFTAIRPGVVVGKTRAGNFTVMYWQRAGDGSSANERMFRPDEFYEEISGEHRKNFHRNYDPKSIMSMTDEDFRR